MRIGLSQRSPTPLRKTGTSRSRRLATNLRGLETSSSTPRQSHKGLQPRWPQAVPHQGVSIYDCVLRAAAAGLVRVPLLRTYCRKESA